MTTTPKTIMDPPPAATEILHKTPATTTDSEKPSEDDDDADAFDFDSIFTELGEFGRYQTVVYTLMCVAVLAYGQVTLTYVFTAGDLNYRCAIPATECAQLVVASGNNNSSSGGNDCDAFHPDWLATAMPISQQTGLPAKCQLYAASNNGSQSATDTPQLVGCDAFVYQTNENNLLRQFNLQCSGNDWKRTIVGSANNAALFVGLPVIGYLSDRCGRKRIFVWGLFGCAVVGLAKSLATSYPLYVVLEMLDALIGSGTFMGAYVLAMELVGPRRRTLSGALVNCCYTVGVMLLGVWAGSMDDYRVWLRVCYAPALLVIAYLWLIPESTRWLFCMGRRAEGARNIRRVARVNGLTLSEEFAAKLRRYCDREPLAAAAAATVSDQIPSSAAGGGILRQFFSSRALVCRTVCCCAVWFVHAFVTYGLTLNSVDAATGRLAGAIDKHTNFIMMCGIEMPACICTYFTMDRWGRRASLAVWLLLAAAASGGLLLTSASRGGSFGPLALFLGGKFAITASFSVLYVYTAEIVPTAMRNGLMSTCSMVGRLGSMLAAQTPLLERYWAGVPLMLYAGGAAATAAMVVLCFPETLGARLPDTVEEALNVGRKQKRRSEVVVDENATH